MPNGVAPSGIVAEIKMRRTQYDGSFLVVEGKDDLRFWKPRRHGDCRLIDGGGKNNVVRSLIRLDEINCRGVLGLVDSNHDHLFGVPLASANLVATDAHDLECLLCKSAALESVLAEHGDADRVDRFEQEQCRLARTKHTSSNRIACVDVTHGLAACCLDKHAHRHKKGLWHNMPHRGFAGCL